MKLILLFIFFPSLLLCQVKLFDLTLPRNEFIDTVDVVLLVSDTSHQFYEYYIHKTCSEVGCKDTIDNHTHFEQVKEDKGNKGFGKVFWQIGYEVITIKFFHSTRYEEHICFLNRNKEKLEPTFIVWNAVRSSKHEK